MKISNISKSVKEVLKNSKYLFLFVLLSTLIFALYLFLPLIGNKSIGFTNYPAWDLTLIISLSVAVGLLFTMQVYSFKQSKEINFASGGGGFIGFVSGFAIILFSSATCVACLSVIFAFLSTGTILTLFSYKNYIIIIGFGLILISLYLISNKIQEQCELCKVPNFILKKQKKTIKDR